VAAKTSSRAPVARKPAPGRASTAIK
jgi:hypothetical protein